MFIAIKPELLEQQTSSSSSNNTSESSSVNSESDLNDSDEVVIEELSVDSPLNKINEIKRKRKSGKRDDRSDPKPLEVLPTDEFGNPILPVIVGKGSDCVTILNLGKVVYDRDNFHTNRYIWPIGFKSQKKYISMLNINKKAIYTTEILDGGDLPIFQIKVSDLPNKVFTANSSSGVWKQVLDVIASKGSGAKTHASGPQMIGLSSLAVTNYIQQLPGAEKCSKYVMQKWIEPKEGELPIMSGRLLSDENNESNEDSFMQVDSKPTNAYNDNKTESQMTSNASSPVHNNLMDIVDSNTNKLEKEPSPNIV